MIFRGVWHVRYRLDRLGAYRGRVPVHVRYEIAVGTRRLYAADVAEVHAEHAARQAVDAIQQQGLAYFDGATRSRGVLSGDAPSHYEAWQHLSPDAERGRVAGCREWMDAAQDGLAPGRWHRLETAWRERVYLTHEIGRNAWLAVLPTARLVVYGWRDRG